VEVKGKRGQYKALELENADQAAKIRRKQVQNHESARGGMGVTN
jgi:hypothetical protein